MFYYTRSPSLNMHFENLSICCLKLQSHTDALTTIQLASRIHRLRRRKHRFPLVGDKSGVGGLANGMNAGE